MKRNRIRFYNEKLLALKTSPNLEDLSLSAVRDCLLNMIAANLLTGGRSSNRNLTTRPAVVQGLTYHTSV